MVATKSIIIDEKSPSIDNGRLTETLALETFDGLVEPLLQANAAVPVFKAKVFSTAEDNQIFITLRLFRGTSRLASRCNFIGEVQIGNIRPNARGAPQINVEFSAVGSDLCVSLNNQPDLTLTFTPNHRITEPTVGPSLEINTKIREVRRIKCPVCERAIRLPYEATSESINYCPHCSSSIGVTSESVRNLVSATSSVNEEALSAAMNELNALVGLVSVKSEISELAAFISVQNRRRALGRTVPEISNHLVFVGNPGTGKTTVARLIARIYSALGICRESRLVETDRAGLVGE